MFLNPFIFVLFPKRLLKRWCAHTGTQFLITAHHTVAPMPTIKWLVEYYLGCSMVNWGWGWGEKEKERKQSFLPKTLAIIFNHLPTWSSCSIRHCWQSYIILQFPWFLRNYLSVFFYYLFPGFSGFFVFCYVFKLESLAKQFYGVYAPSKYDAHFSWEMVRKLDEYLKRLMKLQKFEVFSMHALWIISYFGVKLCPEIYFHKTSLPKCTWLSQIKYAPLYWFLPRAKKQLVFQCLISVNGAGYLKLENLH